MANKKNVAIGVGIAGLLVGGILLATRKAAAVPPDELPSDIILSNLRFQPSEILIGESILIIVTATNHGSAPGEIDIDLLVGSQEEFPQADFRDVEIVQLEPGEAKDIVFTVTPDEIKTYDVSVDGLSGSFMVTGEPAPEEPEPEEPGVADIRLRGLSITFPELTVGETNRISVIATNFGDGSGEKTITLIVNGFTGSKTVFLEPGRWELIFWDIVPSEVKTYNVSVDGLSGSFTAIEAPPEEPPYELPPGTPEADIAISNLTIQFVGLKAIIGVTVTNYASVGGYTKLNFRVNGQLAGQAIYYVMPNASISPTFEYTPPGPGTYSVSVNQLSGSFVWEAEPESSFFGEPEPDLEPESFWERERRLL